MNRYEHVAATVFTGRAIVKSTLWLPFCVSLGEGSVIGPSKSWRHAPAAKIRYGIWNMIKQRWRPVRKKTECFYGLRGLFGGWFWFMLLHTWVCSAFFGMFGRLPNGCYYGCCSPGPSDCFHILGRAMLPTRRKSRKVGVASWFGRFEARYANKSSLCNSAELCNLHGSGTHHILVKLIWWAEQLDGQKCMNPVCTNLHYVRSKDHSNI